jgi:predicted nicotinamide N-methyase
MEADPQDGRNEVTQARPARADAQSLKDRTAFILENTRPRLVPLCAEITLRVADEALPLWEKTEEDLGEMGLPPPFWAFAWAGGQALARYVLDHPETVRGKQVLDLGAGSGLVAIAAMMAGALRVTAADPDPWAGAAIGLNAALNGVFVTAIAEDVLDQSGAGFETVLVGDLFYERPIAERVLGFIDRCSASGAAVLIGDPGRSYLPKDRLNKITDYGVPTTRALEDADVKRTAVWRLAVAA